MELPNWNTYTGHAWRRSAATEAAANRATTTQMKNGFGWSNEKTALRYCDNTYRTTVDMANLISGQDNVASNNTKTGSDLVSIGYVQEDGSIVETSYAMDPLGIPNSLENEVKSNQIWSYEQKSSSNPLGIPNMTNRK